MASGGGATLLTTSTPPPPQQCPLTHRPEPALNASCMVPLGAGPRSVERPAYHCHQLIAAGPATGGLRLLSIPHHAGCMALEARRMGCVLSGPPSMTPHMPGRPWLLCFPGDARVASLPAEPSALKSWCGVSVGEFNIKHRKGTTCPPASGRRRIDADQHWSLSSFIGSSGRKQRGDRLRYKMAQLKRLALQESGVRQTRSKQLSSIHLFAARSIFHISEKSDAQKSPPAPRRVAAGHGHTLGVSATCLWSLRCLFPPGRAKGLRTGALIWKLSTFSTYSGGTPQLPPKLCARYTTGAPPLCPTH